MGGEGTTHTQKKGQSERLKWVLTAYDTSAAHTYTEMGLQP